MQGTYRDFKINYQEHNNTWTCQIEEVKIVADSLKKCKENIDKFINKKSKQKPVKCFVSKYGYTIQEANITSTNNGKIYYTTFGKGSSRDRNQDPLYYIDYGYFKTNTPENADRFLKIRELEAEIKGKKKIIEQLISEFEVMKKLPYGEED